MNAFLHFNRSLLAQRFSVKLWVGVLLAANGVGPLFFLDRPESMAILITFAVAGILQVLLTHFFGFTRILGLGHLPWVILLFWVGGWMAELPPGDPFRSYLLFLALVNGISLLLDGRDVLLYLRGDREEMVPGR